jgi:hypothetical protein
VQVRQGCRPFRQWRFSKADGGFDTFLAILRYLITGFSTLGGIDVRAYFPAEKLHRLGVGIACHADPATFLEKSSLLWHRIR